LSHDVAPSAETGRSSERTIYNELRRNIEVGAFAVGMRLPTERELALRYGVSRKLVRQALDRLSLDGLIDRRIGSGTFVRDADGASQPSWLTAPPAISPLDAIEARRVIEVGAAEMVVGRARDDDLLRLEERLATMRRTNDPSAFRAAAFAFNLEVIRITRNPLLVAMYEMLIAARAQSGWDKLGFLVNTTRERDAACKSTEEFLALLRKCDARGAADQRYRSLSKIIGRILMHPEE
jgi:DNA-binding FadR family transcriptional regulator